MPPPTSVNDDDDDDDDDNNDNNYDDDADDADDAFTNLSQCILQFTFSSPHYFGNISLGTLHSKYSEAQAQNILLLHVSSMYVPNTFGPTLNILLCKLNPSLISVDQLKKVCLLCRYVVKADAQQLSHSRSVLKHVMEKIPS